MQGKVFRLQSEQVKKGEFKETLEALERYAGRAYPLDNTKLQTLFKNLETPTYEEPKVPNKDTVPDFFKTEEHDITSEWERIRYVEDYKMYLKNKERLTSTLIGLYNITWGQFSRKMQDRLKAEDSFKAIQTENNVAGLLKLIKIVSHKFEATVCLDESLWEVKRRFLTYR